MPAPDRLDRAAEGLAEELAAGRTRGSFLGRVGIAVMVALGGRAVAAAVLPEEAQAFHFCGHTWTTGSCPSPLGTPRVDRTGRPLRKSDGKPIDNRGRLVDRRGLPVDEHGHRLVGPDGHPLPRAPRTRLCADWIPELYGHHDAVLQGSWYRCCNGQIRKLWDCCSTSARRINGDDSLVGYCHGGKRVFCVTYRDTDVPC